MTEPYFTGLCKDFVCLRPGSKCTVDVIGEPGCVCPMGCSEREENKVCGVIHGREPTTFRNLCKLERIACLYDLPFALIHEGACSGML